MTTTPATRRSTRGMTTATSSPAGSGTSSSASNSRQSSPRPVRSASALGMVPPSSKKHAATSTGDDNKNSDNTRRTMSAKRRLESSSNETSPVGGNGNDSNNDKENSRLRRAVKQAKVVVSVEVVPRKVSPRKTTSPQALPPLLQPQEIFTKAKSLFRVSSVIDGGRLVGRDKERAVLTRFWQEHVEQGVPGSLYISGAPGTGKSALVDELLAAHDGCATTVRVAKLNCMAVGVSPKNIFSKLLAEVRASSSSSKKSSSATSAASVTTTKDADAIPQLEALMFGGKQSSTKHMHLIVLDEIDQLITKDQDVLYRIFEWPKMKGARCVVIGIANALDLTQRFLPRLQTKNCQPQYLPYAPYDVQQIVAIIKSRLETLRPYYPTMNPPLMQNAAVELCARKVAATGDLRKALDLCRQAVENAEMEFRQKAKLVNTASAVDAAGVATSNSPTPKPTTGTANFTAVLMPTVTIVHTMKVVQAVYGSANPSVSKIKILNMQQKLLLCIATLMDKHNQEPLTVHRLDMTVGRLYDVYLAVCGGSRSMFDTVSRTEFFDLVSAMESTGIIHLGKAGGSASSSNTPNRAPLKHIASSGTNTPTRPIPSLMNTATSLQRRTPTAKLTPGTKGKAAGASGVDTGMTIILTTDERDLMMGVREVPTLEELMKVGLPVSVTGAGM